MSKKQNKKKMSENLEHLNGTSEQKIPLKEGEYHLGGSGFTSTFSMDNIEAKYPTLTLKTEFPENNNIIFYAGKGNEMMRISPEGFFWKGKLVENDKEIYLKVKKFFNMI